MQDEDVAQLNERQRICLRMVYQHMSSKDIARVLKISPHTVDQRLRYAIRRLGVTSRIEAAKILAAHEAGVLLQPTVYQPPYVVDAGSDAEHIVELERASRTSSAITQTETQHVPIMEAPPLPFPSIQWPLPLGGGTTNSMGIKERLAWIFAIAAAASMAFGMILTGIDALSRLV